MLQCYSCGYRKTADGETEPLPDMQDAFCSDFANPTENVVNCTVPTDCCVSLKEIHEEYTIVRF